MKVLAYKNNDKFTLVLSQGPQEGLILGTVEQTQLTNFCFNPPGTGAVAEGDIAAVWGLELEPDLELDTPTTIGLCIGKPFRGLSYARKAEIRRQRQPPFHAVACTASGSKLVHRGRMLHLQPDGAEYTL